MSPVIILGLVLMWCVVLVPMWLRRHDEVDQTRSVDRFSAAMHTLSRGEGRPMQRNPRTPQRPAVLDVHVSGASDPQTVAGRRRRRLARRRSRLLIALVVADLVVLTAGFVVGDTLLWVVQLLLDVSVVLFFVHLRRIAVQAAASRRRAVARRRDNAVLDELEREPLIVREAAVPPRWEEGITVYRAGRTPAAAAMSSSSVGVFDQTALVDSPDLDDRLAADFDEAVALVAGAPARVRMAATDGFFDQETDLSAAVSQSPRRSVIETGPIPARAAHAAAERAEPVERSEPILHHDHAEHSERAARAAAAAAAEVEAVGGKPWEPIPVPRPTYATKPAAPSYPPVPRRNEPLLPPVERTAGFEADDDLEAILDRRWAVND